MPWSHVVYVSRALVCVCVIALVLECLTIRSYESFTAASHIFVCCFFIQIVCSCCFVLFFRMFLIILVLLLLYFQYGMGNFSLFISPVCVCVSSASRLCVCIEFFLSSSCLRFVAHTVLLCVSVWFWFLFIQFLLLFASFISLLPRWNEQRFLHGLVRTGKILWRKKKQQNVCVFFFVRSFHNKKSAHRVLILYLSRSAALRLARASICIVNSWQPVMPLSSSTHSFVFFCCSTS